MILAWPALKAFALSVNVTQVTIDHPSRVNAGRIDEGWARARLISQWREAAPKRWLKTWDDTHGRG